MEKIFLISLIIMLSSRCLIEIFKFTISKEDLAVAIANNQIPARFIIVTLVNIASEMVTLVTGTIIGISYVIANF